MEKRATYLEQLRGLSKGDLENRIRELEQARMNLRFRHSSGQLDNSAELGNVRKRIAQANTILRAIG